MSASKTDIRVAGLYRYPLKSGPAEPLSRVAVTADGLAGDREWMAVDTDGNQITAREAPALLSVTLTPVQDEGCRLVASGCDPLILAPPDRTRQAALFSDPLRVADAGDIAAEWLSARLGRPARLVRRHADTQRGYGGGIYGRFGDAAPLLIVTRASLEHLNGLLDWPVGMDRFRPSIVLDGPAPYAEDGWTNVTIGTAVFDVIEPCIRCIMTTIDSATGRRDLTGEPLRSLASYRADGRGEVHFGVYAAVRHPGTIRLNETAHVRSETAPHQYPCAAIPAATAPPGRRVLRLTETGHAAEAARHLWWRFEDAQPTSVRPGQFIALRVPRPDGSEAVRSFTISAQRRDGREIRLSIRQQGTRGISDFMVNEARPGDTLWATGVHGDFTLGDPTRPALFLSAGSGVTPFLAMLADTGTFADIRHIHLDRTPARAIGLPELRTVEKTRRGYCLTTLWTADRGRLTVADLAQIPALDARTIWICGPDGFVTSMRRLLRTLKIPDERCFSESFVAPAFGAATGKIFHVILDDHPPVSVDAGIPLLQGLRAAGLNLPSSCEIGSCGTCKLRLLDGQCQSLAHGPLTAGDILPCTAYARSDLRLARVPDGKTAI